MPASTLGVAVPSFEQPRYAAEAIASLRALEIPFHAIVQDAGSSPPTLDVLRAAIADDPRITLVVEADDGQADALNRAWSRLLHDHTYVTWLNTDDVAHASGLAALVAKLDASPGVPAVFGDLELIDGASERIGSFRGPNRVSRWRLVHHHNLVPGILPVVRSSVVHDVGLFDTSLHFAMDHDLFVRVASAGAIRRVPVLVAGYRMHNEAKTSRDKPALEKEIAQVRARYRTLPAPLAEAVRLGLRLAWWPTRRCYVRGEPDLSPKSDS